MKLESTLDQITDSLPDDWSGLEIEVGIDDLERYVEAAVFMAECNGQPHSGSQWQWRVQIARNHGHATDIETLRAVLSKLDQAEIEGRVSLLDVREGRSEVFNGWGRTENVRQEFQARRDI